MTGVPAAVAAVTARMRSIEERFDPVGAAPAAVESAFDAFGEVYRAALQARATAPGSSGSPIAASAVRPLDPITAAWATGPATATDRRGVSVPPEVARFGNGRVPIGALTPLRQTGHRLWGPAAQAWDALVDRAAAEGVELRITDSFRTFDQQVDLAERKGLYRDGGLAAVPGTSNHGWGMAVDADVRDPATLDWLRRNGPAFGWVESVPREPWHWEYQPAAPVAG